jgi:hypothetical protein
MKTSSIERLVILNRSNTYNERIPIVMLLQPPHSSIMVVHMLETVFSLRPRCLTPLLVSEFMLPLSRPHIDEINVSKMRSLEIVESSTESM